jgi:hypothetical protein
MSQSSNSAAALVAMSQEIVTYMGMSTVVVGVLGNLLNIIVFLSLKTFRQSSCASYLTVMSFVNIGQLLLGQLSRVMITGFGIDWTQTSLFYCKFRMYAIEVCSFISFTCLCFATIDQFLATCVHIYWQQWSNIKLAQRLSVASIIFWIIYGIPYLIFYNQTVSSTSGKVNCGNTNAFFRQYHTYMNNIILSSGLPMVITVLFGSLAYRNVRQIAYRAIPLVRRELDKQLTNMVLIQVVFSFCFLLPYVISTVLPSALNTSNNSFASAQVTATLLITACIYYLYFAVSIHQIY